MQNVNKAISLYHTFYLSVFPLFLSISKDVGQFSSGLRDGKFCFFLTVLTNVEITLFFNAENVMLNAKMLFFLLLQEQDLGPCHHSDADCTGDTVFDPSFSMSTAEQQQAVKVTTLIF